MTSWLAPMRTKPCVKGILPGVWRELEPDRDLLRFLAVFFGIWAVYDFLDLAWAGTAANYWLVEDAARALRELRGIQLALLIFELLALGCAWSRRGTRVLLPLSVLAAFLLRAKEAWSYFGLNDFFYYSVTAFLALSFFPLESGARAVRWPREALRYQTAWIYFATGVLKLNPHWLSGDHLWIRSHYVAEVLGWPYPAWLRSVALRSDVSHWCAILGVSGELVIAALLVIRAPRWLVVALAAAMHGFAALVLNVWFFGASMVAQVAFVSGPRVGSPQARGFKAGSSP